MFYPFNNNSSNNNEDFELINKSISGNKQSLEKLLIKYKDWIYNIVLRMVYSRDDAEDIFQDIMVKIITNLSKFSFKSSFSTWLFKITINHIINMKKIKSEKYGLNFSQYSININESPDNELIDLKNIPVDTNLITEEINILCMQSLLLCLKRTHRIIFILSYIFNVNSSIGSKILGITQSNYRKILSRARNSIKNFMNNNCGLIDKKNSCLCHKKAKSLIDKKIIDINNLKFASNTKKIKSVIQKKLKIFDSLILMKHKMIFQNQPFYKEKYFISFLENLLKDRIFINIFNL